MSCLVEDPTLKLFGKTIALNQHSLIPDPPPISHLSASSPNSSHCKVFLSATFYPDENSADEEGDDDKKTSRREVNPDSHEVSPSHQNPEPTTSSGVSESSTTSSVDRETSVERETSALKPSTNEKQSETEGKTLKKPGNLVPCPRCNSARTKFCYFNNYNVNQPRHFCKNCQRYWTAGGTMIRVPVGAGRQKNRNLSVSPYPQIILSMSAAHRKLETAYAPSEPVLKPQDYMQNCFTEPSWDDGSNTSSFTASNSLVKESNASNIHLQWRPQFQPPFCSYDPIPFWGCSLSSSWILPSSSANSRVHDLNEAERRSINGGNLLNGTTMNSKILIEHNSLLEKLKRKIISGSGKP